MRVPLWTLLLILAFLSVFYYLTSFHVGIDEKVFITVATFLFAIFAGFFISRQGLRYSSIRDKITTFDGNMSFLYRALGHFGPEVQAKAKHILHDHYEEIFSERSWDYQFTHKSATVSSFHALIEETTAGKNLPTLQNTALARIFASLRDLQVTRKNMIALYQERVPGSQWALLYFLAGILLVSLSVINSYHVLFPSLLKGAFGTSIILALVLLQKLDRLEFFEGVIGEHSTQDVLDILEEKR